MRSAAEVFKISLFIERKRLVRGNTFNDFRFVGFTDAAEIGHSLVAGQFTAHHRCIRLGKLTHFALDGIEIFRGKRPLIGKVIIEAVINHRADGDLRTRK